MCEVEYSKVLYMSSLSLDVIVEEVLVEQNEIIKKESDTVSTNCIWW